MRKIALLFCLVLALAGCQQSVESAPVWTAELADGGTAVLSGMADVDSSLLLFCRQIKPQGRHCRCCGWRDSPC